MSEHLEGLRAQLNLLLAVPKQAAPRQVEREAIEREGLVLKNFLHVIQADLADL